MFSDEYALPCRVFDARVHLPFLGKGCLAFHIEGPRSDMAGSFSNCGESMSNKFTEIIDAEPEPYKDQTFDIFQGARISGWSPGTADDPMMEVHLILFNMNVPHQSLFRMDSREKVSQLIRLLAKMRDTVWPTDRSTEKEQ